MRGSFIVAFFTTLFFVSGYLYYTAQAICPIPIEYRIGTIDDRFALTLDEAKLAAAEAEAVWEDATGQNLFTYDDNADFTINFTYDERQAFTDAQTATLDRLDTVKSTSDEITDQYNDLVARYDTLQREYQAEVARYESALARYNDTVSKYNRSGGAPPEAYAQLERDRNSLESTRRGLDQTASTLNQMVADINTIGSRGNQLVEQYNDQVGDYNNTFGSHREFTQGTYTSSGTIDIYTFADMAELRLVLAHEFGHALSIDHVPGTDSLMYFLIGDQPETLELSASDQAAFVAVCGTKGVWDTIKLGFNHLYK